MRKEIRDQRAEVRELCRAIMNHAGKSKADFRIYIEHGTATIRDLRYLGANGIHGKGGGQGLLSSSHATRARRQSKARGIDGDHHPRYKVLIEDAFQKNHQGAHRNRRRNTSVERGTSHPAENVGNPFFPRNFQRSVCRACLSSLLPIPARAIRCPVYRAGQCRAIPAISAKALKAAGGRCDSRVRSASSSSCRKVSKRDE